MKKPLVIIIMVVLVLIAAGLFIKGFGGAGISGNMFTKRQSIMDQARQQGMLIPNKTEVVKECEKETDQDEKDMCYGLLAFYYRDASFCKYIKDPEIKNNCNQTNIEKWYSEIEKGGSVSSFMPGVVPSGEMEGSGTVGEELENAEPENIPSDTLSKTGPAMAPSGKITDEIYIEILAQTSIAAADMSTFAARMKPIYEKYGVTADEVTAYGEEIEKDPQRADSIAQGYIERVMELRGLGQ